MNIFIASIQDQQALLTPEESWHCSRVLRKKAGEAIHLIDGKGHFFEAVLEFVSDKACQARITSGPRAEAARNYRLHLAIAPTKQMDRVEWMIEKAVEIGVDALSFLQCKNSERTQIKLERVSKIVESAVKQSLQASIPRITALMPFAEALNGNEDQKLIAHCFDSPKTAIKEVLFKHLSTLVLIGPEGDFTMEEVTLAEKQGFVPISLGSNRLRSETAGLYVCQAAALLS